MFGPALLRRAEETPQQLIHDSPILIGLVSSLIEDVGFYFARASRDAISAAPPLSPVAPTGGMYTSSSGSTSTNASPATSSAPQHTRASSGDVLLADEAAKAQAAAAATGALQAVMREKAMPGAMPNHRGNWTVGKVLSFISFSSLCFAQCLTQ